MFLEYARWTISILLLVFAILSIAHNYWCAIREFILRWDPVTQPFYFGYVPQFVALVGLFILPVADAWRWIWLFIAIDPAIWITVIFFPRIIKNSRS